MDSELTINSRLRDMADGELVWLVSREPNSDCATEAECELTVRDIKDYIRTRDAREREN